MMRFPAVTIIACVATLTMPASAETYQLTPANTAVSFTTNWGLFRPRGRFARIDGQLVFVPGHPSQSQADVTLDMSSLQIGAARFNQNLLGPEGFDVAHYPTARFRSQKVEITGRGTANMTGLLTLHGVSRSVVMTVTYDEKMEGSACHFLAVARIRRSDFGLSIYRLMAGDEIELRIETVMCMSAQNMPQLSK